MIETGLIIFVIGALVVYNLPNDLILKIGDKVL